MFRIEHRLQCRIDFPVEFDSQPEWRGSALMNEPDEAMLL
jgi:hypothetical protein